MTLIGQGVAVQQGAVDAATGFANNGWATGWQNRGGPLAQW